LLEKLIPNETERRWFEQWLAAPIQMPGLKLSTAALLWGSHQGTGKSTVGFTMQKLYGHNAGSVTDAELDGAFNEWALDRQFICADEIFGGDGDKRHKRADWLKGFIHSYEHIDINCKFQRPIRIRNVVNLFITSNHPDALFLEDDDRRFFIIEVPEWGNRADRAVFFDRYYAWLNKDGAAHLLDRLLKLDLTNFKAHSPAPQTVAKDEMIALSRTDLETMLIEKFSAKEVFTIQQVREASGKPISERQVAVTLKRLSATHWEGKVKGGKQRMWSLNPETKYWSNAKWAEATEACAGQKYGQETHRKEAQADAINSITAPDWQAVA
jgi:hypothetical protein